MLIKAFNKNREIICGFLFILFINILFSWPLLSAGFFNTDDGNLMLIRAGAFFKSFSDFHIPVRIADNLNYGYGYPIFNFFYPGFFYLSEFFHLLGFGLQASVKISIFTLGLIGSVGIYLLSSKFSKNSLISITVTTFYIFAPYKIIDLYKRGSFGEIFVFAFVPFITLGIIGYLQNKRKLSFVSSVVASVMVIIGHNTLALILLPAAYLAGFIFTNWSYKNILALIKIFLLSLLISASFWVPALFERIYTLQPQILIARYVEHYPDVFSLLIDLPFITHISSSGEKSYPISTVAIIFSLLGLIIFFLDHHNKNWRIKFLSAFSLFCISIFFITPISAKIWEIFSIDKLVQFPWRFLSLTTFSSTLILILVLTYFKKITNIYLILIIGLTIFLYFPQIQVEKNNYPDEYYLTNDSTTVNQSELSTIWFNKELKSRPNSLITSPQSVIVENLSQKTQLISFTIVSDDAAFITVNKMYYPGWKLFINGSESEINYQTDGLINFKIINGRSDVKLEFVDTKVRTVSNVLSILGCLLIIVYFIKLQKKR